MPIVDRNGRPRSVRTDDEDREVLLKDISLLPPHEQVAVLEMYDELQLGKLDAFEQIAKVEYTTSPVDIRTYLTNPYFLGETGSSLWPKLVEDMVELFEGRYHEVALTGCLGLGSLVMGENGSLKPLGELVGRSERVLTLSDTGCSGSRSGPATSSGVRRVTRVTLANGASLDLTPDHMVSAWRRYRREWVAVDGLVEGDLIAVPRRIRVEPDSALTAAEAKLLAYWVADGSASETRARFCDGNPRTSEEVIELLRELGFDGWRYPKGNSWEVHAKKTKRSGFLAWLRGHEAHRRSADVIVPDAVCRASDEVVAVFLNRLWACEGTVYAPEKAKSPPRFNLAMISETFIRQVQLLLLRFGVRGRISEVLHKDRRRGGKASRCWHLTVSGSEQLGRFLGAVGDILGKEGACERIAAYCRKTKPNTNVDLLPVTWGWLNDYMNTCGLARPRGSRWQILCTSKECRVSRAMFGEWLDDFGGTEAGRRARVMFHSDVGYEPVVSVEPLLVEVATGDVTDVELGSCYLANGVLVHNSLGWGKSFFATTALSYVLYQMSCLREPQKAYGIDGGSQIYLAMLSVTEKVAKRVAINEFIGKVSHSRYFKEKFPPQSAPSALEIRFPRQIQVVAGSTGSSAIIGLNAFAGFIDESSFMGDVKEVDRSGRVVNVDKGEAIYKSIIRRMKSRFQKVGRLPGLMIMASSKERPSAFVEKRVQQAREQDDADFFVREYSTWDVRPAETFTGRFFKVGVGDERVHSRIMSGDPDEEARLLDSGMRIIDVPEEYRQDFERDLDGSIRDIAGVATISVSPYIQRSEQIYAAADDSLPSPVGGEDSGDLKHEWMAGTPLTIHWGRIATPNEMRLPGGYTEIKWRPKRNPSATRYAHIDPSLTGDCTGLAIGHISGWTEVIRKDPTGEEYNELAPVIETDLLLRIIPPPGDEILLSDVRSILYQFIDHGFSLGYVSMDQYQSADTIQQLRKRGVEAEVVSVDRTTEAYDVLKTALYEARCRIHRNDWCLRELSQLQRVPRPGGRFFKIDHPKLGADGLPGCLVGDTRISLLDGREVAIRELADEWDRDPRPIYLYTINALGAVTVGCARSPRLTKTMADTVIVTLDNGEEVCCTPDHPFMLRDGSYVEAGNLVAGSSLMPLYRRVPSKRDGLDSMVGYEHYRCPSDGKWHYTHRMVGRWKYGGAYTGNQHGSGLIHHAKGKRNNDPRDLVLMTSSEHAAAHARDLIDRRSDPVFEKKRADAAIEYARSDRGREFSRFNMTALNARPGLKAKQRARSSAIGKITGPRNLTAYNRSDAHREKAGEIGRRTIRFAVEAQRGKPRPWLVGSANRMARVDVTIERVEALWNRGMSQGDLARALSCDRSVVRRVLRERGLSWGDFVAQYNNHMVVSVRPGPASDVYDLTVDGTENFALSAGVFVHNSKDVADALAALVFNLTQRTPGMPVAPQLGVSSGQGERRDDTWVTDGLVAVQETGPRRPGRGIVSGGAPNTSTMPPMPFIKG